jgi:uncharacterized membrane protein YoaK (UPF0700 family)
MPQSVAFAVIAGYADAIGYLRFKAFAGMMTGNTVLMGLAVFHRADLPVWTYAILLGLFVIAAVIAYLLLPHVPPATVLAAEALLIVLADFIRPDYAIASLVLAMGLQNPVAARCGVPLNTTFITGVILRFCEGLARAVKPPVQERRDSVVLYGLVWLGYVLGATLGTGVYGRLPWPSIIPVLLLILIFVLVRHRPRLA